MTFSRSRSILSALCVGSLAAGLVGPSDCVHAERPVVTAVANGTTASAEPTTIPIFDGATLLVPAEFKKTKKANNIIDHEFAVSLGEGDDVQAARVTMMSATGGVHANIDRWIGQFSGSKKKVQPTEETVSGKWNVYVVTIVGEYAERIGGGPFAGGRFVKRPDYAMMGAILIEPSQDSPGKDSGKDSPGQPGFAHRREYFVKMIGPEPVIAAHSKAFKKMVHSVGQ